MTRLLIKFPNRGRVEKFKNTFFKYKSMLTGNHPVQFIVSIDEDDPEMLAIAKDYPCIVGRNKNKVEAINADIPQDGWDIILIASVDMIPIVHGYDEKIILTMESHFYDWDGLLHFNDGFQGNKLCTLPIMGRPYYNRFGYIYHPSYKSLWCDMEQTEVAKKLIKYYYVPEVVIRHEHPIWMKEPYDLLMKRNEAFNSEDNQNYNNRKARNFDL